MRHRNKNAGLRRQLPGKSRRVAPLPQPDTGSRRDSRNQHAPRRCRRGTQRPVALPYPATREQVDAYFRDRNVSVTTFHIVLPPNDPNSPGDDGDDTMLAKIKLMKEN